MLEAEHRLNCFPVRIELGFKKYILQLTCFKVEKSVLLQKGLFNYVEGNMNLSKRETSVLEAGASSALFPSEN
jgi:hypothetical protein